MKTLDPRISSAPQISSDVCPTCHKNLKVIKESSKVTSGEQTYCSQVCADLHETASASRKSG